jgi:hypothetical protein
LAQCTLTLNNHRLGFSRDQHRGFALGEVHTAPGR